MSAVADNPNVHRNNAEQGILPAGAVIDRPTGELALLWQIYARTLEKMERVARENRKLREKQRTPILPQAMKRAILLLISAILIATASITNALPADCAIVATEAYTRLEPSAHWTRVLSFIGMTAKGDLLGHMVAVWQVHPDGEILLYDANGTIELKTHSQKISDIVCELMDVTGAPILEAHFVQ